MMTTHLKQLARLSQRLEMGGSGSFEVNASAAAKRSIAGESDWEGDLRKKQTSRLCAGLLHMEQLIYGAGRSIPVPAPRPRFMPGLPPAPPGPALRPLVTPDSFNQVTEPEMLKSTIFVPPA